MELKLTKLVSKEINQDEHKVPALVITGSSP
jgi:hypothetical protein